MEQKLFPKFPDDAKGSSHAFHVSLQLRQEDFLESHYSFMLVTIILEIHLSHAELCLTLFRGEEFFQAYNEQTFMRYAKPLHDETLYINSSF